MLFIRVFRVRLVIVKIKYFFAIVHIEYHRSLAKFRGALLDGKRQQCMEINQEIDNYQLSGRLSALKARTGLAHIHENNRKSIWKIELLTNASGWPAGLGQHWITLEIMTICKWRRLTAVRRTLHFSYDVWSAKLSLYQVIIIRMWCQKTVNRPFPCSFLSLFNCYITSYIFVTIVLYYSYSISPENRWYIHIETTREN